MRLRRKKQKLPDEPQEYPSGTCILTERGHYYIKGEKRYRMPSLRVVNSWAFPRIVQSSEVAASRYKVAVTKLGFRDGTLIHNLADGKIYLVAENKKRHITSPDVLARLGAKLSEVLTVSAAEINLHVEGEKLN